MKPEAGSIMYACADKFIKIQCLKKSIPGLALLGFAAFFFLSCNGNKTAVIWTDRPEFALYSEYFNASQEQYKVEVRYVESPATELKNSTFRPDIVIGSWLKNADTGNYFRALDSCFGTNKLSGSSFYPRLLSMGRVERKQYLLPVSFNAPVMVFSKDIGELSSLFTIGLEEIKKLSREYNTERNGAYIRMGFSPLWSDEFLFYTATLFRASFREASPLDWDAQALDRAMAFVYEWTHEVNTDNQAEGDFRFKYFFEPMTRLIQSNRIQFTSMDSAAFFTLNEDARNNLDFRWIADQDVIYLIEGSIFLGQPKKSKSPKAASAFIYWFFSPETQRNLLEISRANRTDESVFGISGGFSALCDVTEQIFPRFYSGLLGRMFPADSLTPENMLPDNWAILKERIILPYLHDRARAPSSDGVYPLERRLSDWMRVNR